MINLGSAAQLGIGIAVVLQDHFTKTASNINTAMLNMKRNSNAAAMSAMTDYRNQQAAIAAGAGLIGRAMYNTAKEGADLQHKINQVAIIGGAGLNKTRAELAKMGSETGLEFARRPAEMADALLENVRAGVKTNLGDITRYQTAVASITGEALGGEEGVAKKLIGIQHAMGIASTDFARVANATAAAANISMASVSSIGESMEYAAFTARTYGVSLEDTLALVAKLSQASIEGASAGTALNNMFIQLGASLGVFRSKKQMQSWQVLGINPDEMKKLVDQGKIFEAISAIESASSKLSASDKTSVLKNLLNLRGTRGVLGAFGDPNNPQTSLRNLRAGIVGGEKSNIAITQGRAATNDLASDMIRVQAQWDEFKRSFSEAAAPTLRVILQMGMGLTKVLGAITSSRVGSVLVGLALVIAPTVAVIAAFRAAMMAATIMAVKYSQVAGASGGFGNLMMAGMGMAGFGRKAAASSSGQMAQMINAGVVRQNAKGRWIVAAGQTANWGGVVKKGGQFLPSSFAPSGALVNGVMTGQALTGMGSVAGAATSFFGKAGPWLGKIAGFAGRALPVIGWILTIASVAEGIYSLIKSDKDEPPPPQDLEKFYLRQLNTISTQGQYNGLGNKQSAFKPNPFDIHLQLIIDGQQKMNKTISKGFNQIDADTVMNLFH